MPRQHAPANEPRKYIGVRVDPELREALEARAYDERKTVSDLVVEAIEQLFIEDGAEHAAAQFRDAAVVAGRAGDQAARLIKETEEVQERFDKIKAQVDEKSGIFSDPPPALVAAKKLLERQLEALTQQLKKLQEETVVPEIPKHEKGFWDS